MNGNEKERWLEPEAFRRGLERAYRVSPGPLGAGVIASIMSEFHAEMMKWYDDFIIISPGFERRRLRRTLRAWHEEAVALGERIEGYWTDSCLPADPCPGAPQPATTNLWVANPILYGKWPEDYYPISTPSRPDAVELADLWDRIIAVKPIAEMLDWEINSKIVELLDRAATQLSRSAPGEEPTWADAVAEAFDKFKEELTKGASTGLYILGGLAVVLGGAWAYSKLSKVKK